MQKLNESDHTHIVISGGIGVGKTTLITNISNEYRLIPFFEPVDKNEYLPLFYGNKNKYSFQMQIYLLNYRFRQHQLILSHKYTIQDRCIYEDTIFAKMLSESGYMEKLDYETYKNLLLNMSKFLNSPDLIVYLDITPEIALERIKKRNRECEKNITLEYLTSLHKGYDEWITVIEDTIPVLRIPWEHFIKTEDVMKLINDKLGEYNKNTIYKK